MGRRGTVRRQRSSRGEGKDVVEELPGVAAMAMRGRPFSIRMAGRAIAFRAISVGRTGAVPGRRRGQPWDGKLEDRP
jgi:hypothetical protein